MRKLLYGLVVSSLLASSWVQAAGPKLRADHPETYTVVKGDTLWDISGKFLDNPWYWPEIWHANPQINNPHLIYPGDRLALVYIDGKPRLTKVTGRNTGGVVKLSPKVRSEPIDTPIPTIPLSEISSFLSKTRVVSPEQLEESPYILEGEESRIIVGTRDRFYARGVTSTDRVGVFRRGQAYVDPDTEEFLGLEARAIGRAEVKDRDGEVMTLAVTKAFQEMRVGDRLLAEEDRRIETTFTPSAPDSEIRGKMIAVDEGVTQIGQYDVIVINRGEREGLKAGNVLAAFKAGNVVRDPYTKEAIELPSERAGLVMVFQTYERVSYGLVLSANRVLSIGDEVRNP